MERNTGRETSLKTPRMPKFLGINRWEEVLAIICDNAYFDWKLLARSLKTESKQIAQLEQAEEPCQEKCWKILTDWYLTAPKPAWPLILVDALKQCRHLRLADICERLVSSTDSVEKLLSPHKEREYRMTQAMYTLAEYGHQYWRQIAQKLGLTHTDIADIEGRFTNRLREKCMHALYKWRLIVPLQNYKVTSLVQAVKECNLHKLAAILIPFASPKYQPQTYRKKRTGEAIIHVGVKSVDIRHPNASSKVPYQFSKEVLGDYILNKVFMYLMDALEAQTRTSEHPLISFFQSINIIDINLISRAHFILIVDCGSRQNVEKLYEMSCAEELDETITECLINPELLLELNVDNIELQAELLGRELITPSPSSASSATTELNLPPTPFSMSESEEFLA